MDSNNQMRICNCFLDIGGCFCELNTMKNEGKRIDTNKKPGEKHAGGTASGTKPTSKPKRPLDWDARDLEADGGLPKSGRSVEGRYTNRFWEED
jgi:hypothetical protein